MPGGARSNSASFSSTACGRVIRGDRVDRAVGQALPERVPVRRRPERRIHLPVRVVGAEILVDEDEVMRRDLGRDAEPVGLRPSHQVHRPRRRQVADVEPAAGESSHLDVAEDDRVLGGGRLPREAEREGADPLVHLLARWRGRRPRSAPRSPTSSNASAYVSAFRSVRAVGTHRPSSLKTRTPEATISPISARTSPSRPFVIAPTGKTSARPARAAAARTSAITDASSATGSVFAIGATAV